MERERETEREIRGRERTVRFTVRQSCRNRKALEREHSIVARVRALEAAYVPQPPLDAHLLVRAVNRLFAVLALVSAAATELLPRLFDFFRLLHLR